ncbi:MAG: type 1 glutamine amidotransferase [Candidatus Bathyarchaeota archaeon]
MKKILLFAENGFEDSELIYPFYRFQEAKFIVNIVGPNAKTMYKGKQGLSIKSDLSPDDIKLDNFVAIVIPGGFAPDKMRINKKMVNLVRQSYENKKIIAAICHGPQLLIEAGIVKGKKMTSYISVSTDLKNAGATYINKSVVIDGNIITSRYPSDLPNFCMETIKLINQT